MTFKNLFRALLPLCIMACSNDDSVVTEEPEELTAASFQVIGENANSVFQFAYDKAIKNGTLTNLTDDIGVATDYLTLRQNDGFLSFYSFSEGAFSLDIKNIRTGAVANYPDFYTNVPSRSVVWGTNTLNNVFFGYFGPGDGRVLGIHDVNIQDRTSQDLTIAFDIDVLFQPILFENKVFISFLDSQGNYKLTVYDTESKTLGTLLNFNTTPISILIDVAGNLAVVKNGANATIELYDSDSLAFLSAVNLNFNSGFSAGPIDGAILVDTKLYYPFAFVQPARFSGGPAVFDLETQDNFVIDLDRIAEMVEEEMGSRISITTQTYSNAENRFFVGYAALDTNGNKGGILQISTSGEMISNTTVPFFPTALVLD